LFEVFNEGKNHYLNNRKFLAGFFDDVGTFSWGKNSVFLFSRPLLLG
jgi:hypothetical protein